MNNVYFFLHTHVWFMVVLLFEAQDTKESQFNIISVVIITKVMCVFVKKKNNLL